jgi:hypothetical protein
MSTARAGTSGSSIRESTLTAEQAALLRDVVRTNDDRREPHFALGAKKRLIRQLEQLGYVRATATSTNFGSGYAATEKGRRLLSAD